MQCRLSHPDTTPQRFQRLSNSELLYSVYDWLLRPLITALLLKDRNTATALALKVTISLDNKPKSPSPILWLDIRRVRGLRLSDPFTAPREMSWTTRATYQASSARRRIPSSALASSVVRGKEKLNEWKSRRRSHSQGFAS